MNKHDNDYNGVSDEVQYQDDTSSEDVNNKPHIDEDELKYFQDDNNRSSNDEWDNLNQANNTNSQHFDDPNEHLHSNVSEIEHKPKSNAAAKVAFIAMSAVLLGMGGIYAYKSMVSGEKQSSSEKVNEELENNSQNSAPDFAPSDSGAPQLGGEVVIASDPMAMPAGASQPISVVDLSQMQGYEGQAQPQAGFAPQTEAPISPQQYRLDSPLMVGSRNDNNGGLDAGTIINGGAAGAASLLGGGEEGKQTELGSLLNATATPSSEAGYRKNRNLTLAKGTFINCFMKTRFISEVAGMATCNIPRDIYSETGNVLLIERGSTVIGEYATSAKQGQTRMFVLWSEIRTPKGIKVNISSPATDQLGASGLDGYVNNHWFKRFGNALLFSLIQDGISNLTSDYGNNNQITNTSENSDKMIEKILETTSNIPPTIYKNQGDAVGIIVARDVDFSKVYSLKPKTQAW